MDTGHIAYVALNQAVSAKFLRAVLVLLDLICRTRNSADRFARQSKRQHHHETQRQNEKSRRVEQNTFLTVALSHKFHLGFWCLCAYTHTRVYAQCYTSTILQEKQINVNTKSQFRKLSQILPFSLCIAAKKSTITCISTFFSLLCLKIRCFRCNI